MAENFQYYTVAKYLQLDSDGGKISKTALIHRFVVRNDCFDHYWLCVLSVYS